jgi:hypothetical protein
MPIPEERLEISDEKYLVTARLDLISGIITVALLEFLLAFLCVCQQSSSLVANLDDRHFESILLALISLIPLKNQLISAF